MSNLGNVLAPASTIAAKSSSSTANRGDGAAQNTQAGANPAGTGQAAVVSLSASSKSRAPSRGPNKRVDAAFDKQEAKKTEKDESDRKKSKVDTTA